MIYSDSIQTTQVKRHIYRFIECYLRSVHRINKQSRFVSDNKRALPKGLLCCQAHIGRRKGS